MTWFSEFLIQKKMLTPDAVVLLLVEQTREQPCDLEIAFRNHLLTSDRLLRVIACQSERQVSFAEACREMGFWTPELAEKINSDRIAAATPICRLILKKNLLTSTQLIRLLDEYLATVRQSAPATPTMANEPAICEPPIEAGGASTDELAEAMAIAEAAATLTSPVPPEIQAAGGVPDAGIVSPAGEKNTERSVPVPDSIRLTSFLDLFSEMRLSAMKEVIKTLPENAPSASADREALQILFHGIHELRGLARFAELALTEELIGKVEEVIEGHLVSTTPFGGEERKRFSQTLLDVADTLWALRESLRLTQSELAFRNEKKCDFDAALEKLSRIVAEHPLTELLLPEAA